MPQDSHGSDSMLDAPRRGRSSMSPAVSGGHPRLKGHMGTVQLLLTVLAFTAPIVVVAVFIPFVLDFGGMGAPADFGIAGGLLLLFTVGYTTMTRFIPNPGAFYAYITAGLGRTIGLASSFAAIFGYVTFAIGLYLFLGSAASSLIATTFGGPTISWYYLSLGGVAVTGALGYFRIDLSAKVLTIAMMCEVLIVAIYDAAVFWDGGPVGRSLEPFTFHAVTSGSVGIGVLFAVVSFLGFEATAIFREEVKNARRTIPRVTYLSVVLIGLLYVLTSWLTMVAYGPTKSARAALTNPAGMVPDAAAHYVGGWARDVMTVLVVSSAFAAVLSVQNIISRYTYSLAVDRVLPRRLASVHPHHGSPYTSSLAITAFSFFAVLASVRADPILLYTQLAGIGGFALMVLIFLTGLAVIAFFRRERHHAAEATLWHTTIAPFLGAAGMAVVLYLSFTHFTLITGGSESAAVVLQVLFWAIFVAGLVAATLYRLMRPETYARIGRQNVG